MSRDLAPRSGLQVLASRPVRHSDFYTIIHKHLRRSLFEISTQLGGLDRTNVAERVEAFRGIAGMLRGHARQEDANLAPMLGDASPDLEVALTSSHEELEEQLAAIEDQILRLPSLEADQFEAAALDAYRCWNRFLSAYLMHLDEEETHLFPELGARNPPASGVAGLVTQRGEQGAMFLALLLPILTEGERLEILRPLRAKPKMLERGLAAARETLTPAQVAALQQALELN